MSANSIKDYGHTQFSKMCVFKRGYNNINSATGNVVVFWLGWGELCSPSTVYYSFKLLLWAVKQQQRDNVNKNQEVRKVKKEIL